MLDKNLFERIKEYFKGREELDDSPLYTDFSRAKNSVLNFIYSLPGGMNEIPPEQGAFEINLDNMIGLQESRRKDLEILEESAKGCAANIYGFDPENIEIDKAYLMTTGSSLPIKVELTLRNHDRSGINKTMYIKPFDVARLLGIELYSLIGGIGQSYDFRFNQGVIIENGLEGKHEFELSDETRNDSRYRYERVKFDLVSFHMGLDDLNKPSNYLISLDRKVTVIDFDVLDRRYSEEDKEFIKKQTYEELGMTREEYDAKYAKEEKELRARLLDKKDKIYQIIEIFENSNDLVMQETGRYIKENTDKTIRFK